MKSMTLFVIASVLSVAAVAQDGPAENCDAKIKDLESIHSADGAALHGGKVDEFRALLKQAKEAQMAGDMQKCQASADRAKTIYNTARGK
ncbi:MULTISPECIES: hypothetical protein [Pseudomonas]|jgi:hypothetical protein|uniref:hypothetical protein n=1 Tax=Pseudomonas TaxID=286 RepID=UPI0021F6FAE4|nr:hypothetical protein [Pseudomonas sp. BT-42-2]MCV9918485.1 hypothetical protein [Pseudomonas sp. BT-42-2]